MSVNPYYIIKTPLLTEESNLQMATKNQYQFRVDPKANKSEIRDAVEKMFKVTVVSVNTMNYAGKEGRQMVRRNAGRHRHWKKAIVTLREGDKIELI
jgi:large subunit ribosomal protein L23